MKVTDLPPALMKHVAQHLSLTTLQAVRRANTQLAPMAEGMTCLQACMEGWFLMDMLVKYAQDHQFTIRSDYVSRIINEARRIVEKHGLHRVDQLETNKAFDVDHYHEVYLVITLHGGIDDDPTWPTRLGCIIKFSTEKRPFAFVMAEMYIFGTQSECGFKREHVPYFISPRYRYCDFELAPIEDDDAFDPDRVYEYLRPLECALFVFRKLDVPLLKPELGAVDHPAVREAFENVAREMRIDVASLDDVAWRLR